MSLATLTSKIIGSMPARRGNVYETTIRKRRADGSVRENGPYYIWTRCEGGRMKSTYVPAADVPRFKQEIENGRKLAALVEELWGLAEGMSGPVKKTPRGTTRPRRR